MEKQDKETEKEKTEKKEKPKEAKGKSEDKGEEPKKIAEALVRIMATDIPVTLSVYAGLTKIKGISWSLSNAICYLLKIEKNKKVSMLNAQEIARIEEFIKNPKLPEWLLNRRKDPETGVSRHLIATDLDLQREFDIRKMKKMRCYKGIRHILGQPVRGQRTRSHFRKGRVVGVVRAKAKPGAPAKK